MLQEPNLNRKHLPGTDSRTASARTEKLRKQFIRVGISYVIVLVISCQR